MAKIVILMGRRDAGKTKTIKAIARKLGLIKGRIGKSLRLVGEVEEEVILQTDSHQERVICELRQILAQLSSIQEKNAAILKKVLEEAQEWIDLLKDKPNTIAIIPFTLMNENAMRDLILQPLEMFRRSGNEVILIYLERAYKRKRHIVVQVVSEAKVNKTIPSYKDDEERQADDLLSYLSLKPIKQLQVMPLVKSV